MYLYALRFTKKIPQKSFLPFLWSNQRFALTFGYPHCAPDLRDHPSSTGGVVCRRHFICDVSASSLILLLMYARLISPIDAVTSASSTTCAAATAIIHAGPVPSNATHNLLSLIVMSVLIASSLRLISAASPCVSGGWIACTAIRGSLKTARGTVGCTKTTTPIPSAGSVPMNSKSRGGRSST